MNLYFKPYYPAAFAAACPAVQFSQMEEVMKTHSPSSPAVAWEKKMI